ncbi:MAG TPA: right-handed parallel beta-helix repeat-containing protein [Blastocatellia bacterium]|nr:right-handed parallel beta-helix repeat-containing protein [Blastocatellia bacterium]
MKHSVIGIFSSSSFLMGILFATAIEAHATIRRVPTDYSTIQQAINASVNGDTILVAPGTYVENINFLGRAITVTSEAGPQTTIIDGNQANSVVTFHAGEGPASVISGFTLRNGRNEAGGGVLIGNSSPTIRNNIIRDNSAFLGLGIYSSFGSALIEGNIITSNSGSFGRSGGGISIEGFGRVQILNNLISNNVLQGGGGGGIALSFAGFPVVKGNIISGNSVVQPFQSGAGGGIWIVNGTEELIVQNLITNNEANNGGGIYWFVPGNSRGPLVVNNTIANNTADMGSGIFADGFDAQTELINNNIIGSPSQTAVFCGAFNNLNLPIFKFNNVFSPQGQSYGGICQDKTGMNGNISADPLFVNPSADFHLRPGSPSIDTGDNSAPNLPSTDLDGNPRIQDGNGDGVAKVDMGAYEAVGLSPFDICIQDDSTGNIFEFNSTTGDYQFTNCSGLTLSGIGSLIQRGSIITLQQYASDRRVLARIDASVNKGTASIQLFSPSTTFTIIDRNTANNTCACSAH